MLYLYHVNNFAYHELKDQLLIGRTTGHLVYSSDSAMSGKHAQVSVHDDNGVLTITIEDLGSKNLTVVNRVQIPPLQKTRIKPMSFMEVGSQQFILTENKNMSLETLNEVLDLYTKKAVVKLEKEKTSTNVSYEKAPEPVFEDPIIAKEKMFAAAEKELAETDQLIKSSQIKRLELLKTMTSLKREVEHARALKTELENKKKKIINLKDIAD